MTRRATCAPSADCFARRATPTSLRPRSPERCGASTETTIPIWFSLIYTCRGSTGLGCWSSFEQTPRRIPTCQCWCSPAIPRRTRDAGRSPRATADLDGAYLDTLERLSLAAEFRDDETGRHTERVGEAAALLGAALGLAEEDLFLIRRAAPLHDVGKIAIPDAVLRKPGSLTSDEWEIMKGHATMGVQILSGGRSRVIQLAEEIAWFHHEQWDGNGYPEGRAGAEIPLAARVVMVADVFDALTSDRVYRKAWPAAEVLAYIQQYAGRRFDPQIGALCLRDDVRGGLLAIRQAADRGQASPSRLVSAAALPRTG